MLIFAAARANPTKLGFIMCGCEGLSDCRCKAAGAWAFRMTSFHPVLRTGRGSSLPEAPHTPEVVRTRRPLGFSSGILW